MSPPIIIGGTTGGEGQTIEFFSRKETVVFWNIDDYPVPNDTDVEPILAKIHLALDVMGFHGYHSIKLHSEQPKGSQAYWDKLGVADMTYYILMNVEYSGGGHCNVAVISKKPSDELLRVLGCLKSRGHTALLIEPPHDDDDEEGFFSVESLVENAQLIGGGKPLHKEELTPEDLREDECDPIRFINQQEDYRSPSTEIIDFSERAKHVKGERTVVFWDALDCPFPLCFSSSPDDIFRKITLELMGKGFSGKVSIWAYVEKDSELLLRKNKTWASRIYFLPGENKASSRRTRMLNDMLLLSRDSPPRYPEEASLILVSGQFRGNRPYIDFFRNMQSRNYYLVIITPSKQPEEPDEWPRCLMYESHHLLT